MENLAELCRVKDFIGESSTFRYKFKYYESWLQFKKNLNAEISDKMSDK